MVRAGLLRMEDIQGHSASWGTVAVVTVLRLPLPDSVIPCSTSLRLPTVCRLDELGWESLKRFVAEQEPGKMFHLLSYVFLGSALQRGVKQEWLGVLDIDYIDVRADTSLTRHPLIST